MNTSIKTAFIALGIAVAAIAPAAANPAYSQLAANAGLSMSAAQGLTLSEIAQYHVNRGESLQDRQAIPGTVGGVDTSRAASNIVLGFGMSSRNAPELSLREIAAMKSNEGVSNADKITVVRPTPGAGSAHRQLAASAGLGLDGADGRSANELAAILFNRGESNADAQTVR